MSSPGRGGSRRRQRILLVLLAAGILSAGVAAVATGAAGKRPDLRITKVSAAPASIERGATVQLRVTVANRGKARAGRTVVRAYLGTGKTRGRRDLRLSGEGAAPALGAGKSKTMTLRFRVPSSATAGRKVVFVCADDRRKVRERSETNNCRAAGRSTLVLGEVPPSAPAAGGAGTAAAPAAPPAAGRPAAGPPPPGPGPSPDPDPTPDPDPDPDPDPTEPGPTPGSPGSSAAVPPSPPAPTAPPVAATAATTLADSVAFLYSGSMPVQTGVAPGTIAPRRAAVVRGRVLADDGRPLRGVTVSVIDHPELGRTVTRADGWYDLAVNAGGLLTLRFERPGFLQADRDVQPALRDIEELDDVVLKAYDPVATAVAPATATAPQVARSSLSSDTDGTRRSSLIFMPGTSATMRLPDGSTRTLGAFTVRATEYTEGSRGPEAMPSDLPATSGYTYASDYTLDEAEAAGATEVTFDRPVLSYTDNFLDFPVGGVVPVGSYDRTTQEWVPEENGRVVKVLSVAGGRAALDVDGDGAADTGAALTALGITTAELESLATFATAGDELWRVAVRHFSPWDCNWPYGLPDGADPPKNPKPRRPERRKPDDKKKPCKKKGGSYIACATRALHEDIRLAGTDHRLHYSSETSPARYSTATEIVLSGPTLPPGVLGITLDISVAGRTVQRRFPAAPNQSFSFTWDGKDAYGRALRTAAMATITVGYEYRAVYRTPAENDLAFARFGSGLAGESGTTGVAADRSRQVIVLSQTWEEPIEPATQLESPALGGWTLDAHHHYDPVAQTARLGDGDILQARAIGTVSNVIGAPGLTGGFNGTGPLGLAATADGSVWYTQTMGAPDRPIRVRRVGPDGANTLVATIPARNWAIDQGSRISAAPDGGVYVIAFANGGTVLFHVARGGTVRPLTKGDAASDEPLARTAAPADRPAADVAVAAFDVATGPEGRPYLAEDCDTAEHRSGGLLRIDAGGTMRRVLVAPGRIDGELGCVVNVAVARDGTIFYAVQYRRWDGRFYQAVEREIRRMAPDGRVATVIGGADPSSARPLELDGVRGTSLATLHPDALDVDRDGNLLLLVRNQSTATASVLRLDAGGVLRQALGAERNARADEATNARAGATADDVVLNNRSIGLDVGPEGTIYAVSDSIGIRTAEPPTPGYVPGEFPMPSDDGRELYVFDRFGRHLRTDDAITRLPLLRFGYDGAGRLTSVTDRDDRRTTISRDAAGRPTAITSPTGIETRLTIGADGNLATVTDPLGATTRLTYAAGGLLTGEVDAAGGTHAFGYDANGLLVSDRNPDGVTVAVSGATIPDGERATLTSPLGRTTTYLDRTPASGGLERVVTEPSGAQTVQAIARDGSSQTTVKPDGTTIEARSDADPNAGAIAPYDASVKATRPSGLAATRTSARTVTRAPDGALTSETERATVAGATATTTWNVSGRTIDFTFDGMQATKTLDAKDRVVSMRLDPTLAEATFGYDARGRLSASSFGTSSHAYAYDDEDRLASMTGSTGTRSYTYDARGFIASATTTGGQTYRYDRDALGRITAVTMPSGARHVLRITPAGKPAGSLAPGGGAGTTIAYDSDGLPASTTLPSGRKIDLTQDAAGRLTTTAYPGARIGTTYLGVTERPATLTRTPTAGGTAAGLALGYDGDAITSIEQSGPSTGRYVLTYDQQHRPAGSTLTAAGSTVVTAMQRNARGGLTRLGPFTFTRVASSGVLRQITGEGMVLNQAWDAMGRLASRTEFFFGSQRYAMSLTRDAAGRITGKSETIGTTASTYAYAYDAGGRITAVSRDGTATEAYTYDANGNRTSKRIGLAATTSASYDAADGITAEGLTPHTVSADGHLTARGTDTFAYSARGELTGATVGGQTTTYAYDGWGRRVARVAPGGATTQYLYGDPEHQTRVTAIIAGGELTTLDYDDQGEVFSFVRAGTRYGVATDQVGSPRVVTLNGTIVKTVEYSAFGEVLSDSAPAFELPIGYAGGLPDPATGLLRMGLRDYDPLTGRFTTRDPLGFDSGQLNLYVYAGNDPIERRDPLGLWSASPSGCAEGICGGAKFTYKDGHASLCLEGGVGVGLSGPSNSWGFDFSPGDDKLEEWRLYDKLSASGKAGPFVSGDLTGELSMDGCTWDPKLKGGFCALFYCVDGGGDKVRVKNLSDLLKGDMGKFDLSAKLMMGGCTTLW